MDAIEAVLPAGTLSGAPKIRACQLIGELENNKRGIYGGAIGYIDFTGNMDTCIAIRIAYKKNGKVFVRSGAGIVADSVPETEYQECLNKAGASLKALELAQEEDAMILTHRQLRQLLLQPLSAGGRAGTGYQSHPQRRHDGGGDSEAPP